MVREFLSLTIHFYFRERRISSAMKTENEATRQEDRDKYKKRTMRQNEE